jgi:hypothetical protein
VAPYPAVETLEIFPEIEPIIVGDRNLDNHTL